MSFHNRLSDDAVLGEIGERLTLLRLARNQTQDELAGEAGVSVDTVRRLESGRSTTLSAFLRVLRSLDLLEGLDALIPEPLASPLAELEHARARRRRASGSRGGAAGPDPGAWRWGTR
jgi:transcriptional regulator with XRE-family HTH domain